jgi:hypothetical protein
MAGFMPGESPPEVSTAMRFIRLLLLEFLAFRRVESIVFPSKLKAGFAPIFWPIAGIKRKLRL